MDILYFHNQDEVIAAAIRFMEERGQYHLLCQTGNLLGDLFKFAGPPLPLASIWKSHKIPLFISLLILSIVHG